MNFSVFLTIFAILTLDMAKLSPYYWILKSRMNRYHKSAQTSEIPTICVGNVTVGGTGKTPHTEMILDILQQSDDWGAKNLAMLSLGYKRESKGFQQVIRDGKASFYGDEPLQIKRKFQAVTVAVDKNRIEGCDFLCHPEKLQESKKGRKCQFKDFQPSDLVVFDDALQYIKLRATVNILLIDYNHPIDRDSLLPFGSLRDIPERIADADIIIITKCPYCFEESERQEWCDRLGIEDSSKIFFTTVMYQDMVPLFECADPRYIYAKTTLLFSGIADDTPLMGHVSDKYKVREHIKFQDHHKYTISDFSRMMRFVRNNPTSNLITTEKDAQRILDVNGLPMEIKTRLFYCPIKAEFFTEDEKERFTALLLKYLRK